MNAGTIRISPALMDVTRDALRICLRHYPRSPLTAVNETSQDATAFVEDYARGLVWADFEKIIEAARQWVAKEKYYPKPGELGALANSLTPPRSAPEAPPAPPPKFGKDFEMITQLSKSARDRLGSYRLVPAVWELLIDRATTDEEREQVRNGTLDPEVFAIALEAVASNPRLAQADDPLAVRRYIA
jgi:hypothetical protein